jgi:hypothetical protein
VQLAWTGATGATSYNIYTGSQAGAEASTPVLTGVTRMSASVTSGLTPGKTYFFTVKTVGTLGLSAASNEVSATPATAAPPAKLAATPSVDGVTVSWAASRGATSYAVYMGHRDGSRVPGRGGERFDRDEHHDHGAHPPGPPVTSSRSPSSPVSRVLAPTKLRQHQCQWHRWTRSRLPAVAVEHSRCSLSWCWDFRARGASCEELLTKRLEGDGGRARRAVGNQVLTAVRAGYHRVGSVTLPVIRPKSARLKTAHKHAKKKPGDLLEAAQAPTREWIRS